MKQKQTQVHIPEHVSRVTNVLKNAGFQAFLVGGCVRDIIMEKQPKDWDITTDAHPKQIIACFEHANTAPDTPFKIVYENNFGTVAIINESEPFDSSLRQIEITPFRTETTYSDYRHPDRIVFAKTIEEDLSRRDFTMNALAFDIFKFQNDIQNDKVNQNDIYKRHAPFKTTFINDIIKDMFSGVDDIKKKQIVAVGNPVERFSEDPLRILRGIRFSAQLDFSVSHETMSAMLHVKHLLRHISQERIRDEFIKMIDSKNPSIAIGIMKQVGILEIIIPELLEGDGCEQGGVHRYDVFEHLVHACQHAADKDYPFHVKLAALFHDIGKPRSKRPGKFKPTFYGHEVIGAKMTQKIMERLKFPKSDIDLVVKLVRYHMFMSDTETITLSAVRRMIQNVSRENIWDLMKVRECDRVGMAKTEAPYRLRKYFAMIEQCLRDPISVSQLKIDGNYLMHTLNLKPGPRMGWILHALLEEVLENPEKNTIEYLSDRVKQLELIPDIELKKLGEQGKEKKDLREQEEVGKLHVKHGIKKKN